MFLELPGWRALTGLFSWDTLRFARVCRERPLALLGLYPARRVLASAGKKQYDGRIVYNWQLAIVSFLSLPSEAQSQQRNRLVTTL